MLCRALGFYSSVKPVCAVGDACPSTSAMSLPIPQKELRKPRTWQKGHAFTAGTKCKQLGDSHSLFKNK